MKIIVEHIQYLLRRHDCVIIPGMGALIASMRPAYIGSNREVITPPGRTVCFNASITNNDGLIASSIARREGISFEVAREKTERLCATMHQRLIDDRSLHLAEIGTLHLGEEGNITFHPSGEYSSPLFFGLQPLTMPTLAKLQSQQRETVEESEEPREQMIVKDKRYYYFRLRKSVVRVASCACTAALLWIAGTTFLPKMLHNVDTASLLPMNKRVEMPVQKNSISTPVSEQTPSQATTEQNPVVVKEDPTTDSSQPESGTYYLIVASTPHRSEIDKFMSLNADDNTLKIVQTKTMIRVYSAKSLDRNELVAAKRDAAFKARYPEAWIWQAK